MLQALASVRDHKSKSTMRPRRLVASCAQLQRCVARPCGTLHGKQQGRTAALRGAGWGPAPAPIRLGLFWFSLDLCYLHAWHAHRPFGRGPPPSPLNPTLDLSMTRSSPPSFRPAADGQTGWSQAKQTEVLLQPRCQLGPSACLMHDSVATASATGGSKTGPAPAGDGRAGSRKSGVPVALHRSIYGLRLGRLWIGCYGARGIRKWGPTGR